MRSVLTIATFEEGWWSALFFNVPAPIQAGGYRPFDHHERGHNRTVHLNRQPTMDY